MEATKMNVPLNTISRDMNQLGDKTGNVYESVKIISKRANQISIETKQELDKKLLEFSSTSDNSTEEMHENREQIEVSRYFEKLAKPTLIATQEFIEDKIYYRNPVKEAKQKNEI
ncbi:MAG: DNA-directed RNA polymerase subunit omega [Paludibacter sp.]|jgi:DNA-directed RNA polymerase subunit K/omega|nr:DNA-directed RNA polymerase subunit omega [Paludibacter sp.]